MPYGEVEKAQARAYYQKNKVRILAQCKESYYADVEASRARGREQQVIHRAVKNERSRTYYQGHREKQCAYAAAYRKAHPEQTAAAQLDWCSRNRETLNAGKRRYRKEAYANNVQFRLRSILRSRLQKAFEKGTKKGSAVRDLGCTIDEFKQHLENHFYGEMSWDNQGKYWNIDHIRPRCSFDLEDSGQFLQACHWSNMQPLTAVENLAKGGRWGRETRLRNSA